MRAGSSSESTRDFLTKSSRLTDFYSSSNSFYGSNSSVGLSCPCTHSCVDHPTDLCLIRSPTCSFGPLLPSQFTLSPLMILYLAIQTFPLFSLCCTRLRHSLCVVGQKLLDSEGVFPLGVSRVPPASGKVDPRVVLCQLGHIPRVCHHLV